MEMTMGGVHLPTIYQENGIGREDSAGLHLEGHDHTAKPHIHKHTCAYLSPTPASCSQTRQKSMFDKAQGLARNDSANHGGWLLTQICPCPESRPVPQYHTWFRQEGD